MELSNINLESSSLKYILIACIILVLLVVMYNYKQNTKKVSETELAVSEDFDDAVEEFNNI